MAKSLHYTISGMTCAACSVRIEKALRNSEGVLDASVNLAAEKALSRLGALRPFCSSC